MILQVTNKYKRSLGKSEGRVVPYLRRFLATIKCVDRKRVFVLPQPPWSIVLLPEHTVIVNGVIAGSWHTEGFVHRRTRRMHLKRSIKKRHEAIGFAVLITFNTGEAVRYASIREAHLKTGIPMANIRRWCYKDCDIHSNNSSAPKYHVTDCIFCD